MYVHHMAHVPGFIIIYVFISDETRRFLPSIFYSSITSTSKKTDSFRMSMGLIVNYSVQR